MVRKLSYWDILTWIAFTILMLYLLLKAVGILQSPLIADILAILSAGYLIGKYAMKIDMMAGEIENMEKDLKPIKRDIFLLKKDVANINHRLFPQTN